MKYPPPFRYSLRPFILSLQSGLSQVIQAAETGVASDAERFGYSVLQACEREDLAGYGLELNRTVDTSKQPRAFYPLLRSVGGDCIGWSASHAYASWAEHIGAMSQANSFATLEIAGVTFAMFRSDSGSVIPDFALRAHQLLLEKFEIFGRVFSRYDNRFHHVGDDFRQLPAYGLLAMNSLELFKRQNRLDFISTALKIADMFVETSECLSGPVDVAIAGGTCIQAQAMVGELYDRQGYWMPVDQ